MSRVVRFVVEVRLAVSGFPVERSDEFTVLVQGDGKIKVVDRGGREVECELDGGVQAVKKAFEFED